MFLTVYNQKAHENSIREEGLYQEKLNTAERMIKSGMEMEYILIATELPKDTVEKLYRENRLNI